MSGERLFAVPEPIAPLNVHGKVSATRRRTMKNNELIARGINPATRRPVLSGDRTCGDCTHCTPIRWSFGATGKTYWKCELHRLGKSHSEASDIRRSWPACELFNAAEAQP